MYPVQETPDFIEGPAHIIKNGQRRPGYFSILGRNPFKDGEFDFTQFPIRGTKYYATLDFNRALKSLMPELPSVQAYGLEDKLQAAILHLSPRLRRSNTIATYLQWLDDRSVTELKDRLSTLEGLSRADAAAISTLWQEHMPNMKARAAQLAQHWLAAENHLPRFEDITFTR